MNIVQPTVTLEHATHNSALLIERAGRTCYRSACKEGSTGPFIRRLVDSKHESVLEHASATFRIVCDRAVMAELTRHRLASFSVESTRYVNYSKQDGGLMVIEPPGLEPDTWEIWARGVQEAEDAYILLIGRGVKPEIARAVLPNCLATVVVMTANYREWLHVIRLRTHHAAHPQMRQVAGMIELLLSATCPEVFHAS